ncbi:hypothetical protein SDC9_160808 [bioreactor metagenome]|uniref:Uncharacterized protein n=1 Tax=bioreactor metagenome TaxID=1076179 RepID=A0A645FGM6_9ZZZZ
MRGQDASLRNVLRHFTDADTGTVPRQRCFIETIGKDIQGIRIDDQRDLTVFENQIDYRAGCIGFPDSGSEDDRIGAG